jgi:hypothetical protein
MCMWSQPSNSSLFICIPSPFSLQELLPYLCIVFFFQIKCSKYTQKKELHLNVPDIDDCANNPCQNGATCSDQVNNYTCICAAGYTGTNCSSSTLCYNFIPLIYLSDIQTKTHRSKITELTLHCHLQYALLQD